VSTQQNTSLNSRSTREQAVFPECWRSLNGSELGQWNLSSPSSIISWRGQSEPPSPHAKNSSLPQIIILYHNP